MLTVSKRLLARGNVILAQGLWLRNLFVPMFGQVDWQGRIVSFFMRLINAIIRGIILFLWLIVIFIFFLVWILAPAGVTLMLVRSFR